MTGIVVTGTDTGVGKTVVAAGLVTALGARYWKPVQAGLDEDSDSATVASLAPDALIHTEAYRLTTPCSPHQAAAIDGVSIAVERLTLPTGDAPLVVEGAGGVLVPLRQDLLFADVMARWGLPVVLVARTSLGTINHTLLSIEALRARAQVIAGVAFVGDANDETERVICAISGVVRLGRLPWLVPLNAATLRAAMAADFDLSGLK
ncbi:MAG: dethiobiotin synthase [Pseudomonadota bacterium]|nr:dethiobiotin synthase [Pseudomonadota bacterium]